MRTSLTLFLLCLAFGIYAQTLGGSYPQPIRNSDTAVIKHVDWVQDPEILPDSTLEQLMRDIQAYKEPEMKNVQKKRCLPALASAWSLAVPCLH